MVDQVTFDFLYLIYRIYFYFKRGIFASFFVFVDFDNRKMNFTCQTRRQNMVVKLLHNATTDKQTVANSNYVYNIEKISSIL